MEARARVSVSLPCAHPTTSYWQIPASDIASHCTSASLPRKADVVIVGSGISGTSIAYNLLSRYGGLTVVMLEAREACSGATGRNGGHTKAASYRSFLDHEREHGLIEAVKIARMEYANIRETHAFSRANGIECASTETDTVDILYSEKQKALGREAIARMKQVMGEDPAAAYHEWNSEETASKFLVPNALGSFQYPAGSLSAYAFTTGVLDLALSKGLSLFTETPVESIERVSASEGSGWIVRTSRGQIEASRVILATNGYTAHLVPALQGIIVPLHGQVIAQRPGSAMPQNGLPHTYSFIYENGYEYMISRRAESVGQGDIIIGGGLHQLPESGASRYGNTDDSTLDTTILNYLQGCNEKAFGGNWGEGSAPIKEWSGIMGASADGLPYVGEMPGMSDLWLSASFNGHGMVLCWKAAEALVNMIFGDDAVKIDTVHWFPRPMLLTKERLVSKFSGRRDLKAPGEAHFGERVTT